MKNMIQRNNLAMRVLTDNQRLCSPILEEFSRTHILAGGTAISLHLGHRESIDFDLFTRGPQGTGKELAERLQKNNIQYDYNRSSLLRMSEDEQSEVTLFVHDVKISLIDFSRNPFDVKISLPSSEIVCGIPSYSLLDLGALKVYAMMYRAKLKDMVDVGMILGKGGYTLDQLVTRAKEIFGILYKPEYTYETIINNNWDMTEEVTWLIEPIPYDILQGVLEKEIKSIV